MILMLQSYPFPFFWQVEVITEILRSLKKLLAYIVHPPIPFTFAEKKRIWKSK